MAKYRVIYKPYFKDKNTNEKYKYGRILDLTEERANEILSVGKLIEKIEIVDEVKPKKKSKK